ncbi:hypothetical protein CONLIGDRAFT_359592 [Coniochaeta ligniaria NRRL 30616]|uniref:Membrane insertase YidC/Oxa/ALB C-terminal domain-containing protein n=1 Tax=Coniochaeta ligniaria NRRL 30616 TaxID=1408157 RepID=A0A1J7IRE1_9PEZI|nr:hypothetical protein CONLIGDRAFT_359592 [Coniochaeta ligniaria NRRL 30616]
MLPSRGLSRLRPAFGQGQHSFQQSSRPVARQFGTAFPKARVASSRSPALYDALKARRVGGSLVASSFVAAQQLRLPSQQRYASTQPAQPAAPSPAAAPTPTSTEALPTDVSATNVDVDLSSLDVLNMPEQIGYLKAMGLDFGWGPTAMMEYLLEHVYIYTGMPWWASIVTVGVLIRAALFVPSIKAADTSFKMQELRKNPKYEVLRKQSMDFQNPDPTKMAVARQELSAYHKSHGVEMWRTFIPMLNMPLLYGFFRLFRGMAELPVPTLETGGILWFTDLSAQDPYYIMPIASAVTLFFVMRSSLPYMPAEQANIMKLVSYAMTPLSLIFTMKFSAGLQLFLLTTGGLQALQSWLLLHSGFRKMVGLPPLTRTVEVRGKAAPLSAAGTSWHAPRTLSTTAKAVDTGKVGIVQDATNSARQARESLTQKLKDYTDKGDVKAARAKAKKYEERRALEEKERYYARMEEQRLKALEQQRGQ